MATFAQAWNQAWIDVPDADPLQVRQWAQHAYKRLSSARRWGWLLKQAAFQLEASIEPASVGVTRGSTTVTSAGLFTNAAVVGRQFRTGSYPVYTILARPDANTLTLDRGYEGVTNPAATDSEILTAYVTAPSDLDAIDVVVDLVNQVRIGHWYTQEQLSLLDPTRTNAYSGPIRGLFSGPAYSSGGLPVWEAWPYTTAAATLPYIYVRKIADLADADTLPGVLGDRADILALGARFEAARFPGTAQQKNPYYNLALAEMLGGDLVREITGLTLKDDDLYQQNWSTIPWSRFPLANLAPTADYLRHTDAPAWETYGFGY